MLYKFRVILDAEEDIFRDIAIMDTDTLEDLHNAIVNAFGFDGMEIASFYRSDNEWSQGEEIPLFDTGDVPGELKTMGEHILVDNLDEMDNKILPTLIDKFKGGPVGITTLATAVSESAETIEEVYEPFLIQQGFIIRTPRGREVTEAAYKHLGRTRGGIQGGLF